MLTLQRKYRQSAAVLDELWPIHSKLRDSQMQRMLDYAIKKNRTKLGSQSSQEWDAWLSEKLGNGD